MQEQESILAGRSVGDVLDRFKQLSEWVNDEALPQEEREHVRKLRAQLVAATSPWAFDFGPRQRAYDSMMSAAQYDESRRARMELEKSLKEGEPVWVGGALNPLGLLGGRVEPYAPPIRMEKDGVTFDGVPIGEPYPSERVRHIFKNIRGSGHYTAQVLDDDGEWKFLQGREIGYKQQFHGLPDPGRLDHLPESTVTDVDYRHERDALEPNETYEHARDALGLDRWGVSHDVAKLDRHELEMPAAIDDPTVIGIYEGWYGGAGSDYTAGTETQYRDDGSAFFVDSYGREHEVPSFAPGSKITLPNGETVDVTSDTIEEIRFRKGGGYGEGILGYLVHGAGGANMPFTEYIGQEWKFLEARADEIVTRLGNLLPGIDAPLRNEYARQFYVDTPNGPMGVPQITGNISIDRELMQDPGFIRAIAEHQTPGWHNFLQSAGQMALFVAEFAPTTGAAKAAGSGAMSAARFVPSRARAIAQEYAPEIARGPVAQLYRKIGEGAAKTVQQGRSGLRASAMHFDARQIGEFVLYDGVVNTLTGHGDLMDAIDSGTNSGAMMWIAGKAARITRRVAREVKGVWKDWRAGLPAAERQLNRELRSIDPMRAISDKLPDSVLQSIENRAAQKVMQLQASVVADAERAITGTATGTLTEMRNAALRGAVIDSAFVGLVFGAYAEGQQEAAEDGRDWAKLDLGAKAGYMIRGLWSSKALADAAVFASHSGLHGWRSKKVPVEAQLSPDVRQRLQDVIDAMVFRTRRQFEADPTMPAAVASMLDSTSDQHLGRWASVSTKPVGKTMPSEFEARMAERTPSPFSRETGADVGGNHVEFLGRLYEAPDGPARVVELVRKLDTQNAKRMMSLIAQLPLESRQRYGRDLRNIIGNELLRRHQEGQAYKGVSREMEAIGRLVAEHEAAGKPLPTEVQERWRELEAKKERRREREEKHIQAEKDLASGKRTFYDDFEQTRVTQGGRSRPAYRLIGGAPYLVYEAQGGEIRVAHGPKLEPAKGHPKGGFADFPEAMEWVLRTKTPRLGPMDPTRLKEIRKRAKKPRPSAPPRERTLKAGGTLSISGAGSIETGRMEWVTAEMLQGLSKEERADQLAANRRAYGAEVSEAYIAQATRLRDEWLSIMRQLPENAGLSDFELIDMRSKPRHWHTIQGMKSLVSRARGRLTQHLREDPYKSRIERAAALREVRKTFRRLDREWNQLVLDIAATAKTVEELREMRESGMLALMVLEEPPIPREEMDAIEAGSKGERTLNAIFGLNEKSRTNEQRRKAFIAGAQVWEAAEKNQRVKEAEEGEIEWKSSEDKLIFQADRNLWPAFELSLTASTPERKSLAAGIMWRWGFGLGREATAEKVEKLAAAISGLSVEEVAKARKQIVEAVAAVKVTDALLPWQVEALGKFDKRLEEVLKVAAIEIPYGAPREPGGNVRKPSVQHAISALRRRAEKIEDSTLRQEALVRLEVVRAAAGEVVQNMQSPRTRIVATLGRKLAGGVKGEGHRVKLDIRGEEVEWTLGDLADSIISAIRLRHRQRMSSVPREESIPELEGGSPTAEEAKKTDLKKMASLERGATKTLRDTVTKKEKPKVDVNLAELYAISEDAKIEAEKAKLRAEIRPVEAYFDASEKTYGVLTILRSIYIPVPHGEGFVPVPLVEGNRFSQREGTITPKEQALLRALVARPEARMVFRNAVDLNLRKKYKTVEEADAAFDGAVAALQAAITSSQTVAAKISRFPEFVDAMFEVLALRGTNADMVVPENLAAKLERKRAPWHEERDTETITADGRLSPEGYYFFQHWLKQTLKEQEIEVFEAFEGRSKHDQIPFFGGLWLPLALEFESPPLDVARALSPWFGRNGRLNPGKILDWLGNSPPDSGKAKLGVAIAKAINPLMRNFASAESLFKTTASNLAARDFRRKIIPVEQHTALLAEKFQETMRRVLSWIPSEQGRIVLAKAIDQGAFYRIFSREQWEKTFGKGTGRMYDAMLEVVAVTDQIGYELVASGAMTAAQWKKMRGRWFPRRRPQTEKEAVEEYRQMLNTGMSPGAKSLRERREDGITLEELVEQGFDFQEIASRAVMEELQELKFWRSMKTLTETQSFKTKEQFDELHPIEQQTWTKATSLSEGDLPQVVRLGIIIEDLARRAGMKHRDGTEPTEPPKYAPSPIKVETIEKLRNGYITEHALYEIDIMADMVDGTIRGREALQDVVSYWRRLRTIQSPKHWVRQITDSIATNAQTGRLDWRDFVVSMTTGKGYYADSARGLTLWYDWVHQGRPSLEGHGNRATIETVDAFVNSLGHGTFVRTVFDPTTVTDLLQSMFVQDGNVVVMDSAGALTEAPALALKRRGKAMQSYDEKMASMFGDPNPHTQGEAIRELQNLYQLHELFFKFAPYLRARSNGMQHLDAVEWAAQGTGDYANRNPRIYRLSSQTRFRLSGLEQLAVKTAGKSVGGAKAARMATRMLAGPFWQYRIQMIPTAALAVANNPLPWLSTTLAVLASHAALTGTDGGDHRDLQEALAGLPGWGNRPLPRPVMDYLLKQYGTMRVSNWFNSSGPTGTQTFAEFLSAFQTYATGIDRLAAPGLGGETRVSDLSGTLPGLAAWLNVGRLAGGIASGDGHAIARGVEDAVSSVQMGFLGTQAVSVFGSAMDALTGWQAGDGKPLLRTVDALLRQGNAGFGGGLGGSVFSTDANEIMRTFQRDGLSLPEALLGRRAPQTPSAAAEGVGARLRTLAASYAGGGARRVPDIPPIEPGGVFGELLANSDLRFLGRKGRPAADELGREGAVTRKEFNAAVAGLWGDAYATWLESGPADADLSFSAISRQRLDLTEDLRRAPNGDLALAANPKTEIGRWLKARVGDDPESMRTALETAVDRLTTVEPKALRTLEELASQREIHPALFRRAVRAWIDEPDMLSFIHRRLVEEGDSENIGVYRALWLDGEFEHKNYTGQSFQRRRAVRKAFQDAGYVEPATPGAVRDALGGAGYSLSPELMFRSLLETAR